MTKTICDNCGEEFQPLLFAQAESWQRQSVAISLRREFMCDINMRVTYMEETEEGDRCIRTADLCQPCRAEAAEHWAAAISQAKP